MLRRLILKVVKQLSAFLLLIVGLVAVIYFGARLLLREAGKNLTSHATPAVDYRDAFARFEKLRSREEPAVSPLARSILLTHGVRTPKIIVLFHGYSSSPQQFRSLGERFFQLGYNVLIPLLPHHGLADRKLDNLSRIRAEELRDCADTGVDIAAGLGDKIFVGGLSGGGVLAAWIAENRKEVSRVLLIAPALVLGRKAGSFSDRIAVFLIAWIPGVPFDIYAPDPEAPQYAYPGFSAQALGQLLKLSLATYGEALEKPAAVQQIDLVTTAIDHLASDFATWRLVGFWRAKGLRQFVSFDFPKEMKVPHDMVDPAHQGQKTGIVHPKLIDLMNAP